MGELSNNALMSLPWLFEVWALDHQLPPDGTWKTWVIMGGRGAGKTRAGAEWVRAQIEGSKPTDPGLCRRVALVGDTLDQVRDVMVFGESGILACSPNDRKPVWEASRHRLVWPNGAEAQAFSAHDPDSLRGPQFDAAWADEYGCPSVDKGTNEPNKFIDPKSSESAVPYGSDGRRDDLIQMQYLRAVIDYWGDPARNPESGVYGGPMIDMGRAHVWAWDTRPFPEFPVNSPVWSDAANYARGHWVSGRTSAQPLAAVVAEIAARSGLKDVDVSQLFGLVRGFSSPDIATGRAAIQPLMLAYGFDAMERDAGVRFRMRGLGKPTRLDPGALAVDDDTKGWVETARAGAGEISGRVRLSYVEAEGDFAVRTAEAIFPDDDAATAEVSETTLSFLRSEAQGVVERWLAEARVARDSARFAVPPSMAALGAGDLVDVPTPEGRALYRIDRVEQTGPLSIEAVRFEPSVHVRSDEAEDPATPAAFVTPVPVTPLFLDLPLMTGLEVPHAPHVAVAAEPWPGPVAVYASDSDAGYSLNTTVTGPSIVGVTESVLSPAAAGVWDRGDPLRVRFEVGSVASVQPARLLNGANLVAIGDGTAGLWELFQFRDAALVAPKTFELSMRLRGQAGTEKAAPVAWPVGSFIVLMDGAPRQITLSLAERDLARHYRIGAQRIDPADPTYVHRVEAFSGVGLRPYAPAHLRAKRAAGGDLALSWLRRTRVGGDSWAGTDVPLGEASELYQVRIATTAGSVIRQTTVTSGGWTYAAADQALDGVAVPFVAEVAQVSDVFGPGPFARISVDV